MGNAVEQCEQTQASAKRRPVYCPPGSTSTFFSFTKGPAHSEQVGAFGMVYPSERDDTHDRGGGPAASGGRVLGEGGASTSR